MFRGLLFPGHSVYHIYIFLHRTLFLSCSPLLVRNVMMTINTFLHIYEVFSDDVFQSMISSTQHDISSRGSFIPAGHEQVQKTVVYER